MTIQRAGLRDDETRTCSQWADVLAMLGLGMFLGGGMAWFETGGGTSAMITGGLLLAAGVGIAAAGLVDGDDDHV